MVPARIPMVAGLLALAALPAFSAPRVVVLNALTPEQAPALIRESDRLVWDRATGTAVAELPDPPSASLSALVVAEAEGSFDAALASVLPDFAARRSAELRGTSRYAVKEPAFLSKPAGLVRLDRPEARGPAQVESTCLYEGFETLPIWEENGGFWWHYQGGQPYNGVGDYIWQDADCDAFGGSWSADSVLGGDLGLQLPCYADYADGTDSWMEYAPWVTCAHGAPSADLSFYGKLLTEAGYDYFYYLASLDGVDYFGYRLSGDFSDAWYAFSQDLRRWSGLGDLTAQPHFALAFAFQSDDVTPAGFHGFGARVDSLSLSTASLAVDSVYKEGGPFRLFVYGSGFLPGAWIYVDGQPVPVVKVKHGGLLVAKGGTALKAMVPLGQPVCISVVNPGGTSSSCYTFVR
jgi:hypothetical protein